VPKHDQQQGRVPMAVAIGGSRLDQPFDLGLGEILARPQFGALVLTFFASSDQTRNTRSSGRSKSLFDATGRACEAFRKGSHRRRLATVRLP
jgi:hypothetical protein